ncbi:MAG: serine/threonine protein kinase [Gemmataceae bacterium]|nr:serine/threonine protein kinase [Gemmataceae bacterium]
MQEHNNRSYASEHQSPRSATFDPGITPIFDDRSFSIDTSFRLPGVTDRYSILNEIARGGMGTIYLAWDKVFGRQVAMKTINDAHDPDQLKARFLTEARITGQLEHVSIPPVFDLGLFSDGRPYMTMKLIRGTQWLNLLRARKNSSQDLLRHIEILHKVSRAVGFAHRRGYIHRDLKPANIMVEDNDDVQVMDWGLAKQLISGSNDITMSPGVSATDQGAVATKYGAILGTLSYMAPEQARGDSSLVGPQSDVYSLGVILYEILMSKRMRTATSWAELLNDIRNDNSKQLAVELQHEDIDSKLAAIAWACLSQDSKRRPEDANELGDAIQDYLYGQESDDRAVQAAILRTKQHEEYKSHGLRVEIAKLKNQVEMIKSQYIVSTQGDMIQSLPADTALSAMQSRLGDPGEIYSPRKRQYPEAYAPLYLSLIDDQSDGSAANAPMDSVISSGNPEGHYAGHVLPVCEFASPENLPFPRLDSNWRKSTFSVRSIILLVAMLLVFCLMCLLLIFPFASTK